MKSILVFLACILSITTFSQNGDCFSSIVICKKDSFEITFSAGTNNREVPLSEAACFDAHPQAIIESNLSAWIYWKAASDGLLLFTITPNGDDDIDFVIFKVSDYNCTNKKGVRCIASGLGNNCAIFGPTGLREGEKDFSEPNGCFVGSSQNNFLAPLSMLKGEQYVLYINNAQYPDRERSNKAKIKFTGTALLGCESTTAILDAAQANIKFYPNPAYTDLYFETSEKVDKVLIMNSLGQTIKTVVTQNANTIQHRINISTLPTGYYTAFCKTSNSQSYYHKFIKQ